MKDKPLPPWDAVLSAAARLQSPVPGAVVVGGTAAAMHAHHRFSQDAGHTVGDLREKFDEVLADLESVAGWKTARIKRPVMILGSLDGIETGVRQLIREQPLETMKLRLAAGSDETITFPTAGEMLRIKAALIIKRSATRDYVDTAALCSHLGADMAAAAFDGFEGLYPQPGGGSATQQLIVHLTRPRPYDLDDTDLSQYKGLDPRWSTFKAVEATLATLGAEILGRQGSLRDKSYDAGGDGPSGEAAISQVLKDAKISPGSADGKVRVDWDRDATTRATQFRELASQYPEEAKKLAVEVFEKNDPAGFERWDANGRKALLGSARQPSGPRAPRGGIAE